jgi:hypothetical protein
MSPNPHLFRVLLKFLNLATIFVALCEVLVSMHLADSTTSKKPH